jgi:two-component system response regulator YesN
MPMIIKMIIEIQKRGLEMYKVFIVDDEAFAVKSLIGSIDWEEYGFTIAGEALDGADAYNKILELKPDVVFVDIRMSGMNGLDLVKRIKDQMPDIQFIVMSECREFTYVQKALNYGVLRYCLKPFDEEEIVEALKKAAYAIDRMNAQNLLKKKPLKCTEYIPGIHANENIKRVVNYVNNHYAQEISLQSISELFNINPNYLSQLFKREIGITFSEYLTKLRISYASELLADTNLSISHISQKAGYNDYFYFTKVFKKITGETPNQYRHRSVK